MRVNAVQFRGLARSRTQGTFSLTVRIKGQDEVLKRYTACILRYRWATVALATLLTAALAAGVAQLTVDNNHRALFNDDDPRLVAFDTLQETFTQSDSVLIAVAPREGTVFSREVLEALEELTEAAWQTPHSLRVDSLANYNYSRADGDDLIVERLVENAGALTEAEIAEIERIALGDSDIKGNLVSSDGRVAGISITLAPPEGGGDAATIDISDHLASFIEGARGSYPDMTFHATGNMLVNRAMSDAVAADSAVLVPAALLIILVLTLIVLRSIWSTVCISLIPVLSVASAMGLAGWSGLVLTPVSSGVPVIVTVIAVADSIHVISTTLSGIRRGLDKDAAITEAMAVNAWPVFLTSATTAVGFLSLNASDAPPFHVLGNAVAFGVACAFVYTMTLLPALLSILPLRAPKVRSGQNPFFEWLADLVTERPWTVSTAFCLIAAILVAGIPRLELGDNFRHYFDERYEIRIASDFIAENLTGLDRLEYTLNSGQEGGITDPAYLHRVDEFANWFREQPDVAHVQAFSDIMKRLNQNMNGDDPEFYRLPESRELAAQYLLLYELSLPFGSDLNDRIDILKSATRMVVIIDKGTSRDLRIIDERAQAWLRTNSPEFLQNASGLSSIVAYMTLRNLHSMLSGTIIAMALISLILIGALRSVRLGLISFVPNFLPAFMTLGCWGFLVGQIGVVSSVVLATAFGIIVDDTIHFLSSYRKARRKGLDERAAVRHAIREVGPALWTTTLVLSAGFLALLASGFELSWVFGLLVAMTVVFALVADFLLLPALLMAFDKSRS